MKYVVTSRNSPIISSLLVLVVLLSSLSFAACDGRDLLLSDTPIYLEPASYDGWVAVKSDSHDDWEWKVDPMPQGEYKYEWEIWSISSGEQRNQIKSWENYSGTAYHRFDKAGEYEITVDIVNKAQDTIAEASAKVITRNIILTASEDWIRPGQEVVFTINDENPPKDPVYEWDFGDGIGSQWETDTTKKHVFENPGWYSVIVALREQGSSSQSGKLAVDSTRIHVGHPATLLVPQPPLYAGVKYQFSLEYDVELPTGHDYWWEISTGDARRTDTNTFEWTFLKEGTYGVRGEIRHTVNINAYTSKDDLFAFGQATISVTKAPELTIKVPPPPLQAGKEYTLIAQHEDPGKIPEEPYYKWDFGDSEGITIPFSNEATHAFAKEGKYTIRVEVFDSDGETDPLLGTASANVIVDGQDVSTISYIQQTTHLLVAVRGATTEHYSSGESRDGSRVLIIYTVAASTTWSDNHFTNKYFK